jgi:hypothetical protein
MERTDSNVPIAGGGGAGHELKELAASLGYRYKRSPNSWESI